MEDPIDRLKNWILERTEPGPDLTLFHTRFDWLKNPRNAKTIRAVVLESCDWVNVVALTPNEKILVVRQYRFGIQRTTIEIPAGLIEPGENPEHAAVRELTEETGYTSDRWTPLGRVEANPAFLNNHCYLWLARDVVKTVDAHLDAGEELVMDELTFEEVKEEIKAGRMRNTYSLLGLARVFDFRDVMLPY